MAYDARMNPLLIFCHVPVEDMTSTSYAGTLKDATGRSLVAFTNALLDHRANNAKNPKEQMESAFNQWVAAREDSINFDQFLEDRFRERHHLPRKEAQAAYEAFKQQVEQARHVYKTSHRDLDIWLRMKFTGNVAAFSDPIYTKYVNEG